jgi:transposase
MRLLEAGHSYRSVAEEVEASLSSIVRWQQSYQQEGTKGLRPRASPGRPALLSAKQKEKVVQILVRGPLAAGYQTDLWTLRRIREVIAREFGIRYSLANCWKLMRALGWSCQKPEKRARERNEAAIRRWKRSVWPHIKKR